MAQNAPSERQAVEGLASPSDWADDADALAQNLVGLQHTLGVAAQQLRQLQASYDRLLGATAGEEGAPPSQIGPGTLTRQERRVAALAVLGKTDREVAELLHLSVHTVKSHVKSILRKNGLRSRWQLGS
jgi:DNA-binding NarL/FixJ family response regulator